MARTVNYIVTIKQNNKTLYFHHEELGFLGVGGGKVKKETTGYFTDEKFEAYKFCVEWLAKLTASGYEGAEVIEIHDQPKDKMAKVKRGLSK